MPCKTLELKSNGPLEAKLSAEITKDNKSIVILMTTIYHGTCIELDRNQAHLLKLWLEEHLK